ncbi:MAG: TetR/AcrR family transcriptional regulator [Lachnospiraceae bacterium]|nr:TetR/AcrR family transcriptional regulator [Lachnospiraceae bacterium]
MERNKLSKQQQKSQETKERIFRAAKVILQKQGYQEMSIKNICKEAGVSNGSFYHHFKTKDDLLSYYIEEQPGLKAELLELPKDVAMAKEAIVYVYLHYVEYCESLGVGFIAEYYNTKNQALHPELRSERPYPIITVRDYVNRAMEAGVIRLNVALEDFTTDIRMIVIGNVFEWCLRGGKTNFANNMRRSLGKYLDSTID